MITVEEFLEEAQLGLRLLTPTAAGARIRTAYVSELPDPRRYLAGGELLLTNGLWREHERSDRAYVERLAEAGVSALGFGLTARGQVVPRRLVAACELFGLPLVEVPERLSFSEIIEEVVARGSLAMRRSVERSEIFLQQAARGGGPAAILRVLARERELDTWLMIGPFVMASAGHTPDPEEAERAWHAAKDARSYLPVIFTRTNNTTATVFEISPVDGPLAILVYSAPLQGLSDDEREAVDQALPLLALELARRHAQREMARNYALDLFELLLSGEPQLGPLRARLEVLKLASDPLRLAVGRLRSSPDGAQEAETLEAVDELAELALVTLGIRGIAAVRAGELIILLSDATGGGGGEFCRRLRETVGKELRGADPVFGLGSIVTEAEGLRSSFVQARYAARAALAQAGEAVADWTGITSHRALLHLHPPEVLQDFARAVLGPVIAADYRRNSALLPTLRAFFSARGRLVECAQALHIHPNTLRYRLARIEKLAGRVLADPNDQVDLFIALDVLNTHGAGAEGRPMDRPPGGDLLAASR